jgi:hypothetical protein
MDQLDRLGWAAGLAFRAYGPSFGVRTNEPALVERVRALLPPGTRPFAGERVDGLYSLWAARPAPRPGVRPLHVLHAGAAILARTPDLDVALETLRSDLQLTVAAEAHRRIFVHAGVVGWRGRAILVPGRSDSGKSTLVAALVRAGATYYSDEYAVLDEQGRVHPFPVPLQVRAPGAPDRRIPVESLAPHARAGRQALPVGLVVLTRHRAGARFRPRALTRGEAMLALLDNTVPARRRPERALAFLEAATREARACKGARGEADAAARLVLDRLAPDGTPARPAIVGSPPPC